MRLRTLDVVVAAAAGGARGPSNRAPLGLPLRLALTRSGGRRACGRLGRRAQARSRRDHGRPRLAPARGGAAAEAARAARAARSSCSATTTSSTAEIRSPRAAGLTDLSPARLLVDESCDGRATRPPRADGRRRPACVSAGPLAAVGARGRVRGPAHPALPLPLRPELPARPGRSISCSAGTCTTGRSRCRSGATGSIRFAHPSVRFATGLYERPGGTMHVSPGLGTTFVPFRFFARPEATELVLQRPADGDDLERHPRELCRRRGAGGRRGAGAGGERDSQAQGCAHLRRRRASARRATSRRGVGCVDARCRTRGATAASLRTSARMAKVEPESVDVIVDEIGPQ